VGGKEAELKSFGATLVLDRHAGEDTIVQQIKEATDDKVTHVLDTVNMPDGLDLAFKALPSSTKGKVARLLPMGEVGGELRRGHECVDVMFGRTARTPLALSLWPNLAGFIEKGDIKPMSYVVAGRLDAEATNAALDAYRDGTSKGQPHFHIV